MELARQTGGPLVDAPVAMMSLQSSSSSSSSSGCSRCGLCESLASDGHCESCQASKCPVCGEWIVGDEANAHINECLDDIAALEQVQKETKAKASKAKAAKAARAAKAAAQSGKNAKSKRKATHLDNRDLDTSDDSDVDILPFPTRQEQERREQKIASRPVLEGFRLCNASFDGCGKKCKMTDVSCPNCRRRLVSAHNSRGEQFHHGQQIWFLQTNQGFPRAGNIVDIGSDGTLCVRYQEKHYAFSNYDEFHSIETVSTDVGVLDCGKRTRTSQISRTFEPPQKKERRKISAEAMSSASSSSSSKLDDLAHFDADTMPEPKPLPFRLPLMARKATVPAPEPKRKRDADSSDSESDSDDSSSVSSSVSASSSANSTSTSTSASRLGSKLSAPKASKAARPPGNAIPATATTSHARQTHSRINTNLCMTQFPDGVNFTQAVQESSKTIRLHQLAQLRLFKLLIAWCFGKNAVDNSQAPDGDALEPHTVRAILEHPSVKVDGAQASEIILGDLVLVSGQCPTHPSEFDAIASQLGEGVMRYKEQLSTLNSLFLMKHKTQRTKFDNSLDTNFESGALYRPPEAWSDVHHLRSSHPIGPDAPLNLYQFRVLLDMAFRKEFDSRETLEEASKIRGNRKQANGENAMYGSIRPLLVDVIISKCKLQADQRFIDIGSGIGQIVLQVAACVGAESLGIEIDAARHSCGVQLQQAFNELHREFGGANLSGRARLIQGDFLNHSDEVLKADVLFLNNFGGWWSSEKTGPTTASLEDQLIELLKRSRAGTQIVTMSPLHELCGWMDKEEFVSPDHATSWIQDPIRLYHYTKKDCWRCTQCSFDNYLFGDQCEACSCRRSRRQRTTRSTNFNFGS